MTKISFSRQLATGVAAFLVTALLVLSTAPMDQHGRELRLQRDRADQILSVSPQRHG